MRINDNVFNQIKLNQFGNELDEKEYLVYVKGEEKDYEYVFTGKDLKNKRCPLRYVEDADGSSSICGGQLKETENGFECQACGQHFVDVENENNNDWYVRDFGDPDFEYQLEVEKKLLNI